MTPADSPVMQASLAALALLGHTLLCVGVVNRVHGWGGPKWLIDVLTIAAALFLVAIPAASAARLVQHDAVWSMAPSLNAYGLTCAVVGLTGMAIKLVWIEPRRNDPQTLLSWHAEASPIDHKDRRDLWHGPLAQLLSRLPKNEALSLSIDRKVLLLPRLPSQLEGLRIVHLSDLHMTGRIGLAFYEAMVDRVNSLAPDVICLTGDIIESEACFPWLVHPLGRLQAPLGVYYVLGNHDAYIDQSRTHRLLGEQGFIPLTGRWTQQRWRDVEIALGGSEAPWGAAPPLPAELVRDHFPTTILHAAHFQPHQERPFCVVLSHSPDQFAWCHKSDADLVLAGHTHGGQVQIPWWGPIASPSLYGTRYACGVFRRGKTVMHTTRGIAGKTPLRWRCVPEIAELCLCARRAST